MGVLHSYFYIALLVGVFLVYQLSDFAEHVIFAFFSFWVWQIAHNVKEDTARPLLPKYVVGTSIARLLLPLYIFGCPKNFIRSGPVRRRGGSGASSSSRPGRPCSVSFPRLSVCCFTLFSSGFDPTHTAAQEYGFCIVLVAWVALQAAVLQSQAKWGARWFVPRRWRPQKYDYHREVRQTVP